MPELVLRGDSSSIEEDYIKEYILKQNIIATPFPDSNEINTLGSYELNIGSLHESIRLSRVKISVRKTITEHFEVFAKIMMMLENSNINFELADIYTPKEKILTLPDAQMKPKKTIIDPCSNHVDTIIGRINLTDHQNEERNLSIGIGYNKRGINVCFGTNIMVCSNMSLFGQNFMSSYGADRISLPEIFSKTSDFIEDAQVVWETNNKVLDSMNQIKLSGDQFRLLLGDMKLRAVGGAYFKGTNAPLDVNKTSQLASSYLKLTSSDKDPQVSLYDIYNMGTEILTHQRNLETVWPDLQDFGNYIQTRYSLHN